MDDQIATIAHVTMTMLGFVIQFTLFIRSELMIPYSVLNIHFQTIATAAGANTIGRKKMARNAVCPLILAFSMTATISDKNSPSGTVSTQKYSVFRFALQNSGLVNISI